MKKRLKHLGIVLLALFLLLNISIAIHSYSTTHFVEGAPPLAAESLDISFKEKLKIAIFGMDIPKPKAKQYPEKYEEIHIPLDNGHTLAAWHIQTDSTRLGTVLMFHGFMDEKSAMLPKANEILRMGYDVFIVDFMGSGDSYGTQSTIGYLEADNVIASYEYVSQQLNSEEKIFLYGFSMGAVAIMKAQHDHPMDIAGMIVGAPYSTLYNTITSRASLLGVPKEPTSTLFTFWIGAVNGFNAFDAQPIEYAKDITIPILHMCGMQDQYISVEESEAIFNSFGSTEKRPYLFKESKHENYLSKHREEWIQVVHDFLSNNN